MLQYCDAAPANVVLIVTIASIVRHFDVYEPVDDEPSECEYSFRRPVPRAARPVSASSMLTSLASTASMLRREATWCSTPGMLDDDRARSAKVSSGGANDQT